MKKSVITTEKLINNIYKCLLQAYGPQGWWPLKSNVFRTGYDSDGYHKGDYSLALKPVQRYEIVLGAILTQNTSWNNVGKVLDILIANKYLDPKTIINCKLPKLANMIRTSGYYNQKARKLKHVSQLFFNHKWLKNGTVPSRTLLLATWGIGPETADSILLYAFGQPEFVIDAYTKRLLLRFKLIKQDYNYNIIQDLFYSSLARDYKIFNEYHALIVKHAKVHCRKAPLCQDCPLMDLCVYSNKK